MPPPPQNITILGAGITGLQTALTLATAPSPPSSITLIAQYLPGNTHPTYTSPWAGGHWRSHASSAPKDALARAWDARTYAVWRNLLAFGDGTPGTEKETVEEREKRIGLGVRTSFNYWGTHTPETVAQGEGLWWRDVVDGFEVLSEEELGKGVVFGVKYESVCINVPRYLEYMFERVKRCGVRVINTTFETGAGLRGVVDDVKVILKREGLESPDIIINATGLSARLFADEDEQANLTPIRGQTVLVKGEAKAARTITHFGLEDEVAYVIPRI
ncbi:putative D-amino-acid oxidase [Glarea lozoyensis 74030]|uniref:Putative D-amino-acid oxidase n=1 Tax=Glarea lozoyensis (strain ATCC 74030 / MF5533) TaxID=1104152 RepID=H0EWF7_GLAL7|nr:putative D-amino-acid oxidase [Glarea lozoyensis 74030]